MATANPELPTLVFVPPVAQEPHANSMMGPTANAFVTMAAKGEAKGEAKSEQKPEAMNSEAKALRAGAENAHTVTLNHAYA